MQVLDSRGKGQKIQGSRLEARDEVFERRGFYIYFFFMGFIFKINPH